MLNPAGTCTICNETGHHPRNCPALSEPLKNGFFAPQGGRNYGGDEEDERASKRTRHSPLPLHHPLNSHCRRIPLLHLWRKDGCE